MQKPLSDYLEEENEDELDEPVVSIGKSVRNAAYRMIKPELPEKRQRVYEIILSHPDGVTRKQIARELGWPINCVTGRVTELRDVHHLIREVAPVPSPCYDGRMFPNGVLKPI